MTLLFTASLGGAVQAQEQPTDAYTFHVYEDLVQVPTLVLNRQYESYPNLAPGQFSIELDKGPTFHPRHLRLQGNDPISLALVLDVSDRDGMALANALSAALDQVSPDLLQSEDAVSVYAMDCVLVRSLRNTTATPPTLHAGITNALAAPNLHGTGLRPHCGDSRRLWDTVATVAGDLGTQSGRRVLLIVSDGFDEKSKRTWESARRLASTSAVTLIAIRPTITLAQVTAAQRDPPFLITREDVLSLLCGETGGIDLYATPTSVALDVRRVLALLRKRYILEFARPTNATPGLHSIDVSISDGHALVRTSGATFPLQDKTKLNDPQALRSDPSRAPLLGTRKGLATPQ